MTENRDFLGRGWGFPVRTIDGRLAMAEGDEKVRESIWIILSTAPGERQMVPEFGCGIHDLVFQPNTPALHGVVQANVREALSRFEPRIDVLEVHVEAPAEEPALLLIRADYRIRANNAAYNLVYPFFLQEGLS